ncbi:MAG: hypothetical protein L0Z50_12290 [Verrucomicrobiales bacterium]|nr:hypothetical protein [Verrucomicrobiales bacterium]
MKRRNFSTFLMGLIALMGAIVVAPTAQAGPPLICWPFEIVSAASLPWDSGARGWNTPRSDYNVSNLTRDTLALLTSTTPVIVRMETLRRATVYASKDRRVADELLTSLMKRAREAEAKGQPSALALFDAGYLAEAYKQMRVMHSPQMAAPELDGYKWVVRAIHLRGSDAEMEFAAALISARETMQAQRDEHWRKAVAGATDGTLLAKNLVTHSEVVGVRAKALAEVRVAAGSPKQ